eukprot:3116006-Pleurochrysis_carterae.AAC.1
MRVRCFLLSVRERHESRRQSVPCISVLSDLWLDLPFSVYLVARHVKFPLLVYACQLVGSFNARNDKSEHTSAQICERRDAHDTARRIC